MGRRRRGGVGLELRGEVVFVGDVELPANLDGDLGAGVQHFGVAGEVFVDDGWDRGVNFGTDSFRFR